MNFKVHTSKISIKLVNGLSPLAIVSNKGHLKTISQSWTENNRMQLNQSLGDVIQSS